MSSPQSLAVDTRLAAVPGGVEEWSIDVCAEDPSCFLCASGGCGVQAQLGTAVEILDESCTWDKGSADTLWSRILSERELRGSDVGSEEGLSCKLSTPPSQCRFACQISGKPPVGCFFFFRNSLI